MGPYLPQLTTIGTRPTPYSRARDIHIHLRGYVLYIFLRGPVARARKVCARQPPRHDAATLVGSPRSTRGGARPPRGSRAPTAQLRAARTCLNRHSPGEHGDRTAAAAPGDARAIPSRRFLGPQAVPFRTPARAGGRGSFNPAPQAVGSIPVRPPGSRPQGGPDTPTPAPPFRRRPCAARPPRPPSAHTHAT